MTLLPNKVTLWDTGGQDINTWIWGRNNSTHVTTVYPECLARSDYREAKVCFPVNLIYLPLQYVPFPLADCHTLRWYLPVGAQTSVPYQWRERWEWSALIGWIFYHACCSELPEQGDNQKQMNFQLVILLLLNLLQTVYPFIASTQRRLLPLTCPWQATARSAQTQLGSPVAIAWMFSQEAPQSLCK